MYDNPSMSIRSIVSRMIMNQLHNSTATQANVNYSIVLFDIPEPLKRPTWMGSKHGSWIMTAAEALEAIDHMSNMLTSQAWDEGQGTATVSDALMSIIRTPATLTSINEVILLYTCDQ